MAETAVPSRPSDVRRAGEQLAASLPALLVAADRVAQTVAQGVHGRRRAGLGEAFWQFRHYQPGDPARMIDWRQSAKTEAVFVRENEWEVAATVWLWRDGSPSMAFRSADGLPSKKERADLLLLALGSLLVRGGERIGLLGDEHPPGQGRAALRRIAPLVAGGEGIDWANESLPPPVRVPRFGRCVWIGDFLSPLEEIEARLRAMSDRRVEGHLMQIFDPAEMDLPYAGRVRFEGVEGEEALTVGRADRLHERWRQRLADRRAALQGIVQSVGWSLSTHRTDQPPNIALLALFGALNAGRTG